MARVLFAALLVSLVAAPAARGQSAPTAEQTSPDQNQTRTLNLSAYAELLRADVRLQKVAIITQVMAFSESEDKAFWPIYREYDTQMAKLGEERVALIAEYAARFEQITDDIADDLARKALDLERRRQETKGKCYERVKAALNGRAALRFLQVEHQLQQLIDLQISAALPIVGR